MYSERRKSIREIEGDQGKLRSRKEKTRYENLPKKTHRRFFQKTQLRRNLIPKVKRVEDFK